MEEEYRQKLYDFGKFADYIKWNTAIGEDLAKAEYQSETKPRADNPQLTFTTEKLVIENDGYRYTVNVRYNSRLTNETVLLEILLNGTTQGLLAKEEIKCTQQHLTT